jgi:transcriptional regulator with XRE-family HTH domain
MSSISQPEPARPDPAAAAHPTHGIGDRLARLRTERKIRVSALARQVGVSPSLISQIERGQSRPSVSTLFELSQALDVPVDAFFRDAEDRPPAPAPTPVRAPDPPARAAPEPPDPAPAPRRHRYVVRRDERDVIEIEGGVQWESLTPRPLEELEFLELVYGPHAQSSPRLYRHPGTEIALVLSGELHIHIGFERFDLQPGDSIQFPSSLPHRYVNPGDVTARAVTVILHDHPPEPPTANRRP